MFNPDTNELDALILVGDDPASAERCLAALVAVSSHVTLRTWVIELRPHAGGRTSTQQRCAGTRVDELSGSPSARINRALAQGDAPLVLLLDGSSAVGAGTVRGLLEHIRRDAALGVVGLGALVCTTHAVRPGSAGPALLLRREALERVGAFPEDDRDFEAQAEAEAWCRRAERAGAVVQLTSAMPPVPARVPPSTLRLVPARRLDPELLERRVFRGRFASDAQFAQFGALLGRGTPEARGRAVAWKRPAHD